MNPKADISICFGVFIFFEIFMDIEEKYKFRFNPKSNRLQNYDYSSNGAYFITICTKDRQHYFWEVVDWKMILCSIGIELKREIENIPIFRKNVALDCIHYNAWPYSYGTIFEKWILMWGKDVSPKHLYKIMK